jgi:hypothetical protein
MFKSKLLRILIIALLVIVIFVPVTQARLNDEHWEIEDYIEEYNAFSIRFALLANKQSR